MIDYDLKNDCHIIRSLLSLSQEKFSELVGLPRVTIARVETGAHKPSLMTLENIYTCAYQNKILINKNKIDLLNDDADDAKLLFHSAKKEMIGEVNLSYSDSVNDFGKAFYLGESYEQAATWISTRQLGSVYCFYFDKKNLNYMTLNANKDWMIAILYYRGQIDQYKEHPLVKEVIKRIESCDYIIAPIADNTMYDILSEFANRSITDEQCRHALSANNLGNQFVMLTNRACRNLKPVARLYLTNIERDDLRKLKFAQTNQRLQKVKVAKIKYRRKGKYIDELFK